jgi:lysophospholipid acyltransferase (LPLAT)-like uncharacterized protein
MLSRANRRKLRNWIVGLVGPPLVRSWTLTLRLRWLGEVYLEDGLPHPATNGIVVFWHQRLLAFGGYFRRSGFAALISQHGDGEMIARIIERLGMRAIRGSTSRGGSRALREILKEDVSRLKLAVTPDGPRGPRHVFQAGTVYLASRTGLPVYPLTVAYARSWSLNSWDGFLVPYPFTRALVHLGNPVQIPPEVDRSDVENWRLQLEESLRSLTERTDEDFAELYAQAKKARELPARERKNGTYHRIAE